MKTVPDSNKIRLVANKQLLTGVVQVSFSSGCVAVKSFCKDDVYVVLGNFCKRFSLLSFEREFDTSRLIVVLDDNVDDCGDFISSGICLDVRSVQNYKNLKYWYRFDSRVSDNRDVLVYDDDSRLWGMIFDTKSVDNNTKFSMSSDELEHFPEFFNSVRSKLISSVPVNPVLDDDMPIQDSVDELLSSIVYTSNPKEAKSLFFSCYGSSYTSRMIDVLSDIRMLAHATLDYERALYFYLLIDDDELDNAVYNSVMCLARQYNKAMNVLDFDWYLQSCRDNMRLAKYGN